MEGSGKLPESESSDDIAGSIYDLFSFSDDDDSSEFSSELVEEVMQELWKEINSSSATVHANLSSPPASSQATSSGTHALEGNNESCGPAVSDSASTVMAGVEIGGCKKFWSEFSVGKAEMPVEEEEEECEGLGDGVKMEEKDEFAGDGDDE